MGANQILSSDSEAGTFEHAACVLFVEIQVTNCAREIGASPRTLKGEKIQCTERPEAQRGCGAAVDGRGQGDDDVIGP